MEREIFYTDQVKVSCNGENGNGHPLVYLDLSKDGKVVCPYCSRMFVYREKNDSRT